MTRADEIRAKLKAATPGEWQLEHNEIVVRADGIRYVIARGPALGDRIGMGQRDDAILIADAPSDLAYLLDALLAATERAETLEHSLRELLDEDEPKRTGVIFTRRVRLLLPTNGDV